MFVGIDIGAQFLDAAASAAVLALPRRVPNTADGITTLVVCEATGNYHRPLLAALLLAEVPVSVLNPAQLVAVRTTQRGRHKTDRLDAKLLARLAELHHTELRRASVDEPDLARLRQLVGYRDDLVAQTTAARNRLHAATWAEAAAVMGWLERDLADLEARRKEVEQAIATLLATRPETAALTSQKGVGLLVAGAVLAYLPPTVLGHPKAAAAYAGLHPRHTQSGQRDRSRLSKQGCPPLRRYLGMAALAAIRYDPEITAWHQRLLARGKASASAICAVAHKLLRRMMGRLRDLRAVQAAELPLAA